MLIQYKQVLILVCVIKLQLFGHFKFSFTSSKPPTGNMNQVELLSEVEDLNFSLLWIRSYRYPILYVQKVFIIYIYRVYY